MKEKSFLDRYYKVEEEFLARNIEDFGEVTTVEGALKRADYIWNEHTIDAGAMFDKLTEEEAKRGYKGLLEKVRESKELTEEQKLEVLEKIEEYIKRISDHEEKEKEDKKRCELVGKVLTEFEKIKKEDDFTINAARQAVIQSRITVMTQEELTYLLGEAKENEGPKKEDDEGR